jgi:hypothetical protein
VRLAILLVATIAPAQQFPKSACDFDGFDLNSQLAEVKAAATAYYGCATGRCLPMLLKPGDPVVVSRAEGSWTCGYLVARDGAAQGWIHTNDIHAINPDPNPPLSAWLGEWKQDDNRIMIRESHGKLRVRGRALWHGRGDTVHIGEISAETTPAKNRLHLSDGPCEADLALLGKYMLANDNNMCGGSNVRFWGVWKRQNPPDPLK